MFYKTPLKQKHIPALHLWAPTSANPPPNRLKTSNQTALSVKKSNITDILIYKNILIYCEFIKRPT